MNGKAPAEFVIPLILRKTVVLYTHSPLQLAPAKKKHAILYFYLHQMPTKPIQPQNKDIANTNQLADWLRLRSVNIVQTGIHF